VPRETSAAPAIVTLAARAMATRFEFVLAGRDRTQLRAIGEEALAEIRACEETLSSFSPGSLIARVNRLAGSRWVEIDPVTFELLETCAAVHRASGAAFDITVGPLMQAFGFRDGVTGDREEAARAVGMDGVKLDPARCAVRFSRPGMALDLGAVGKGHALDLAAEILRENGVDCACLHGGTSTIVAIGAPPGEPGWRVSVGPFARAPVALLRDASLSVSAPHGRSVQVDGENLGHVLDPRTKAPTRAAAVAAVIADKARVADAWSTAFVVQGPHGKTGARTTTLVGTANRDNTLNWTLRSERPGQRNRFLIPETKAATNDGATGR
jgi:thiamine biosynthesis lipoprotein